MQIEWDDISLTAIGAISSTATVSGYAGGCQYPPTSTPMHNGHGTNTINYDNNPDVYGPAVTFTSYIDVAKKDRLCPNRPACYRQHF
jgi:hypothetical protein